MVKIFFGTLYLTVTFDHIPGTNTEITAQPEALALLLKQFCHNAASPWDNYAGQGFDQREYPPLPIERAKDLLSLINPDLHKVWLDIGIRAVQFSSHERCALVIRV